MNVTGKRRFKSIVEEAISSKTEIKAITADTFRSDTAAILESLLAEFKENVVVDAMDHQGFEGKAYRSTIRTLAAIVRERRSLRQMES